ncbi:Anaphase-promoting complex subunit 5 [Hibiscus syriacus]|uniref:Anaphase-promoting complex subunit 5 n=1 Tax=Hibiscus syriacus TaxID=106335 RepID=A0A6A2ZTN4_HIBSY|nr:Anaphase-promoting complex subunit 5 [Hibiscus syriacus]
MAGAVKAPGAFAITPHKVSVCILVHTYDSPSQISVPFPFSSVSQHSRLGLYLLALTKSCDDILEPKLDQLINQLKEIGGLMDNWLTDHVTSRLSSLSSPDDLFNFFNELRGVMDDDQGVCHLLTNIGIYCKEAISSSSYERRNGSKEKSHRSSNFSSSSSKGPFNIGGRRPMVRAVMMIRFYYVEVLLILNQSTMTGRESSSYASGDLLRNVDPDGGVFLRTNWQIQGYLMEQADAIENSFTLNAFELTLRQLQKLAPEFHRVGTEGFDFVPPAGCDSGRFEIALLCLGMMQFHIGHPKEALEVLTEAVLVSQQHCNDTCLEYTLAAICNLLSEIGFSTASGILGSPFSPMTNVGTSLSVQQQLFVLLKGSLKRAESLKLKQLIAANHLAMAKFDLMHLQRPLLSFGPKTSMKLRTWPIIVCKELRSGYHLISDFCSEGSTMTTDGAFSTAWLKNLQKPMVSRFFVSTSCYCMGDVWKYLALIVYCVMFLSFNRAVSNIAWSVMGSSMLVADRLVRVLNVMGAAGRGLLRRGASRGSWKWHDYGLLQPVRVGLDVMGTSMLVADRLVRVLQGVVLHVGAGNGTIMGSWKWHNYGLLQPGPGWVVTGLDAFAALKIAEEKFLCVSKSRILILKLQLLHERALHRGHLKLAQQVCDELGVLASSVTAVDLELKTEASLRHSRTLLAAKQFSQAAAVAHSLFCMCYKFNLQVESAAVLLLLAEIHMKSGNAVVGLPYALASLSYCQSFNLDLLRASATLRLAELWLSLGSNHTKTALSLLHGAFPMILGHGDLELCARAYITEAKCSLSDPSFSVSDNPELVLDPLRQAADELQALEVSELFIWNV